MSIRIYNYTPYLVYFFMLPVYSSDIKEGYFGFDNINTWQFYDIKPPLTM